MRIKKTSETRPLTGSILNVANNTDTNTYSCNYINGLITSGSNANGSWVKYPDGTMICYGTVSKGTQTFNQVYYTDFYRSPLENITITYPQEFISSPVCDINIIGAPQFIVITSQGTATATPSFTPVTPIQQSNIEIIANYIAVGKWK